MTSDAATSEGSGSFLLIHGMAHGAWCWYKIVALLRSANANAIAIDLPSHGIDRADRMTVTLDSYVDATIAALERFDSPPILVAHSMGGIVITAVAERRPDLVRALVYVSAFLLPNGETIDSYVQKSGLHSDFFAMLQAPDEENSIGIAPGRRREVLYGESPRADVELARLLIAGQPLGPLGTPTATTPQAFGSVPRYYVRCTKDKVITLPMQDRMLQDTACEAVEALDADHSPFFSRPEDLATVLHKFSHIAMERVRQLDGELQTTDARRE